MTGEQVRALGAGLLLQLAIVAVVIVVPALVLATVWCYAFTLGHLT